ncbi:hypothetical protein JNE131328_08240 [Escherichia coli]|nr:hypothetical protein EEGS03_12720 [Escherichia coli]BDW26432.1 hypothetical protein JNE131328_08240 [Escherichia coli]BDW54162.1 hypothetical protein JNE120393_15950 [Escherichia coli]GMM23280.1 hypothetical protein KTU0001_07020 [Escherichia coli]
MLSISSTCELIIPPLPFISKERAFHVIDDNKVEVKKDKHDAIPSNIPFLNDFLNSSAQKKHAITR